MGDVFLDAFIDSLKVLAVLVAVNFLIALIEPKLSGKVKLKGRAAPLVGTTVGLLPQCGFSVVATDLYQKRHITVGTLLGVYLATSDEALPIFLAQPDKALHILPFLAAKLIIGIVVGYAADLLYTRSRREVGEHAHGCQHEPEVHFGCCGHTIEEEIETATTQPVENGAQIHDKEHRNDEDHWLDDDRARLSAYDEGERIGLSAYDEGECIGLSAHSEGECAKAEHRDHTEKENYDNSQEGNSRAATDRHKANLERYIWHPIGHSLKIFLYIFIINVIFGIIIYAVGEDSLLEFLNANKYVAPLFSVGVGAIPNCASSVVISDLYLMGGLGFGAALGGLCMNAGLGFAVLFKNVKAWRENLVLFAVMFSVSIGVAYAVSAICSFMPLQF